RSSRLFRSIRVPRAAWTIPGVCRAPAAGRPPSRGGTGMPLVIDAVRMSRTLARIAHEIVERNRGVEELAFVGIRTRGVPLARRLAATVNEIAGAGVPVGSLHITLHRDDLMRHAIGTHPVVRRTEINF